MAKLFKGNRLIVIGIVIMCMAMLCIVLFKVELNDIIKSYNSANDNVLVLQVPDRYSTVMSSVPGLKVQVNFHGKADQVRYTTDKGSLLTWKGSVTSHGKSVTLPIDESVFWSPLEEGESEMSKDDTYNVNAEVLKDGENVAEQTVLIKRDSISLMYYPVENLPNVVIIDNEP